MTIQQFIERAIEGGYPSYAIVRHTIAEPPADEIAWLLLRPEAWKAVGKVEGWHDSEEKKKYPMYRLHPDGRTTFEESTEAPDWLIAMHRMIDSLADGKSIEEFLATL